MPFLVILLGIFVASTGYEDAGFTLMCFGMIWAIVSTISMYHNDPVANKPDCPPHKWTYDNQNRLFCSKCMSRPGTGH